VCGRLVLLKAALSLFWSDLWLEGRLLCHRFSRLAELAVESKVLVAKIFQRGWSVDGAGWRWRICLFVWEEEFHRECCFHTKNVYLRCV
jgi:hypothetical protein